MNIKNIIKETRRLLKDDEILIELDQNEALNRILLFLHNNDNTLSVLDQNEALNRILLLLHNDDNEKIELDNEDLITRIRMLLQDNIAPYRWDDIHIEHCITDAITRIRSQRKDSIFNDTIHNNWKDCLINYTVSKCMAIDSDDNIDTNLSNQYFQLFEKQLIDEPYIYNTQDINNLIKDGVQRIINTRIDAKYEETNIDNRWQDCIVNYVTSKALLTNNNENDTNLSNQYFQLFEKQLIDEPYIYNTQDINNLIKDGVQRIINVRNDAKYYTSSNQIHEKWQDCIVNYVTSKALLTNHNENDTNLSTQFFQLFEKQLFEVPYHYSNTQIQELVNLGIKILFTLRNDLSINENFEEISFEYIEPFNMRKNSTTYTALDIIRDSNENWYQCIQPGTSDITEPTFSLNSTTITDGTVIWKPYKILHNKWNKTLTNFVLSKCYENESDDNRDVSRKDMYWNEFMKGITSNA